jgi:hypothetical protein
MLNTHVEIMESAGRPGVGVFRRLELILEDVPT